MGNGRKEQLNRSEDFCLFKYWGTLVFVGFGFSRRLFIQSDT